MCKAFYLGSLVLSRRLPQIHLPKLLEEMLDFPHALLLGGNSDSIPLVSKVPDTPQDGSEPFVVRQPPANARRVAKDFG